MSAAMAIPTHMHFVIDCRERLDSLEADDSYSATYEGIVLAKAVEIVERETGLSPNEIGELLGVSKSAMYRYRTGVPVRNHNAPKRLFKGLEEIREESHS